MSQIQNTPVTRRARLFREVIRAVGRRPYQRVCPLPMAFAAIAVPFLAAWATAAPDQAESHPFESEEAGRERAAKLPEASEAPVNPWAILDRARRQPAEGSDYVDLYGPLEPWERDLVARQGYVAPGR